MKNFAKTVSRFLLCERLSDWAKLGLRVFIGFMMLTHGIAKIEQFDTLKSTFPATMGMSSKLSLILIILVEVGCSSLVLLGFMTRLAVLPLMFSMIIAAFFTFSPISLSTAELPMALFGNLYFYTACGSRTIFCGCLLREDFSFRNLVRKHGRSLILKDRYHRNRN